MNNYDLFKMRAVHANNDSQHERMIRDKLRTLHRALLYSYQAGWIKKDKDGAEWCRALINPDKVKFDYDEKIVSVPFESGFQVGDSFEWPRNSNIHWLILKPELTELAYFRANIRKCEYLEAIDPEAKEKISMWAAVRGPVETKINTIQKAGLVADVPNLTLNIYVKRTDATIRTFTRYNKFKFMGKTWKVTTMDWISTPGILEFTAQEDYECGTDEELLIEKVDPNPTPERGKPQIIGATFTKPLQEETFYIKPSIENINWSISLAASKNKEIDDVVNYSVDPKTKSITVVWTAMTSGSYILKCGDIEKIVAVESLF